MEILNPHVQRAMEYLELMTAHSQTVSVQDLDKFAVLPLPRPEVRGTQLSQIVGNLHADVQIRPAQPVTQYLLEMGWIAKEHDSTRLTTKGRLVLTALREAAFVNNSLSVTLLDPESPFVYADVETQFLDERNDLLVDRYVDIERLKWSFEKTTVRRILTTKKSAESYQQAVTASARKLEIEVRVISHEMLHDRALTRLGGSVLVMGQSLDGFGRQLSLMIELPPSVASPYFERLAELWERAEPLELVNRT